MKPEEEYEEKLGELCREELEWVEEKYEMDKMDPWLNGYRNALVTVLRSADRRGEEKMKPEDKENVQVVTRRLVKAWLELRQVISTLPEGEDVERLRKGKAKIEDGLGVILLSLEVQ
ncbi:MAG: hypothetical protein IMF19_07395 [Proteobacteria bacterium]|nr:hypothetical protein [Pseudomonadota bacterium]